MIKSLTFTVIALSAIGLTVTGCFPTEHTLTQAERMSAEIGARRYAEPSGEKFGTCFTVDKNGDGLITCTIANAETKERIELLCGYRESKIGCRRK